MNDEAENRELAPAKVKLESDKVVQNDHGGPVTYYVPITGEAAEAGTATFAVGMSDSAATTVGKISTAAKGEYLVPIRVAARGYLKITASKCKLGEAEVVGGGF